MTTSLLTVPFAERERQLANEPVGYLHLPVEQAIDTRASRFDEWLLEGHAAYFGTVNSYREVVDPGAFTETIQLHGPRQRDGFSGPEIRSQIKYLWMHETNDPMGIPLILREDSAGLLHQTKVTKNDTNEGRLQLVKDGVVDTFSIGFKRLDWDYDDEDRAHLQRVRLYEYSSVTFPAEINAQVHYSFGKMAAGDQFEMEEFIAKVGKEILMQYTRQVAANPALCELAINVLHASRAQATAIQTGQGDTPPVAAGANGNGAQDIRSDSGETSAVDPELYSRLEEMGSGIRLAAIERRANDRRNA